MDPAPQLDSSPTMPDPARVVSKTVAMAGRQGLTERHALALIMGVTATCEALWVNNYLYDLGWFRAIREEASRRLRGLTPPTEQMEAEQHGGETRSGRTADGQ